MGHRRGEDQAVMISSEPRCTCDVDDYDYSRIDNPDCKKHHPRDACVRCGEPLHGAYSETFLGRVHGGLFNECPTTGATNIIRSKP